MSKSISNLCEVSNSNGRECLNPVTEGCPLLICDLHAAVAAKYVNENRAPIAAALATRFPPSGLDKMELVYYVRFGDRVKIGTTTNLANRLSGIPHDEVMAVEPGGYGTEHIRHLQFAGCRSVGEWFVLNDRLTAHVKSVRSVHGDPFKAVVRWKEELAIFSR